jgi:serine/threonine protein kinase
MLNLGAFLTGVLQLHTDAGGSAVPDAFGPFRVLHQIGAGALGPVFRAYDAEGERLVAVKLFRLDLPPDGVHQLVDAFERLIECELSHPSLVVPIATGIVGASAYLAVEYVSAESLDLAVREYGPAPPLDAVRLTTQLAAALDFAAAVAAVHGSMHPRDILLSASETRITGIGVARALERVGVAVPIRRPYTAPERIAGRTWDRRGDIFSLAALSYEMLWGRRIAGTGSHVADSLTELSGARLSALKDAYARALADDPTDRFGTALDFADALSQAFESSDSTADSGIAIEAFDPEPVLPLEPVEPSTEPMLDVVTQPTSRADLSPAMMPPPTAAEDLPVSVPARPAQSEPPERAADLALRVAERERDEEVETASSIVPVALPEPSAFTVSTAPAKPVERKPEPLADFRQSVEAVPSSRSRSIAGPVAAALVAGMALGFAGGYAVSMRDRPTPPSQEAAQTQATAPPAASPAVTRREATDVTVADPPKPTPSVPPRSAAPKAETAAPSAAVSKSERRTTPSASSRQTAPRTARAPEHATAAPASGTAGRFVGALHVESRPDGARVFLDGRLIGTTPMSIPGISAGEHAIRLERDGYRRWSSSIRIVSAEQNRVTASLER